MIKKQITKTTVDAGNPCCLTVEYDIVIFGLLKFRWCDSVWVSSQDVDSQEKIDKLANAIVF